MIEKKKRNRLGNLMKPMGVAKHHADLIARMEKKEVDPVYASRLSAMYVAQRGILESTETEAKLNQIEERLERLVATDNRNVVQFKRA